MVYLIVLVGTILGMLLTIIVQSELINRSEKYEAGFNEALKFYLMKKRGAIYAGLVTILIFMFVIPELSGLGFEKFFERVRIYSIFVGIVSQALGFLLVKKSHEKLLMSEKKKDS